MQPMSSMQTALLPGVTPGWNDPPPLGNPSAGNRLNRYRRVVDPSLSAAGDGSPYASAPQQQQGMPMGGMPPAPQLQQQYGQQQPQPYGEPAQLQHPLQQVPPMMMQPAHQYGQQQPPQQYRQQQPQQYGQQPAQYAPPPPPPQQQYGHQQQQYGQPAPPMQPVQQLQPPMPQQYPQTYSIPGPTDPTAVLPPQQPLLLHQHEGVLQNVQLQKPLPQPTQQPPAAALAPTILGAVPGGAPMIFENARTFDALRTASEQAEAAEKAAREEQARLQRLSEMNAGLPAYKSVPQMGHDRPVNGPELVFDPMNTVIETDNGFYYEHHLTGKGELAKIPDRHTGDMSHPAKNLYWCLIKASVTLQPNALNEGVQTNLKGGVIKGQHLRDELLGPLGQNDAFVKQFNTIIDNIDRAEWDMGLENVRLLGEAFPAETHFTCSAGQRLRKLWMSGIEQLIGHLKKRHGAIPAVSYSR